MNWHDYFTYDATTGNLIWRVRPIEHFVDERACKSWNTRYSLSIAGAVDSLNEYGHRSVSVNGKRMLVHRVIWEMRYGPIPDKIKVDHKDCDATNNRIENLRLATNAQNSMNSRIPSNNSSGFKGVSFHKASGKWRADIRKDKLKWLGTFDTPEEAHEAYKKAAQELHGQFARFQ